MFQEIQPGHPIVVLEGPQLWGSKLQQKLISKTFLEAEKTLRHILLVELRRHKPRSNIVKKTCADKSGAGKNEPFLWTPQ